MRHTEKKGFISQDNKDQLTGLLNDGQFMDAGNLIRSLYQEFMLKIDEEALLSHREKRSPKVNLKQFSEELNEVYEQLNEDARPFFVSAMKSVVNIKAIHRESCITAVQSILSNSLDAKHKDIHASTKLGEIPGITDIASDLYGQDLNEKTTVGELYERREEMKENAQGSFARVVSKVVKKFSHNPNDDDYKEFVRQLINLKILAEMSTGVTERVKQQQETALAKGLPAGYAEAVHDEVRSSNEYAVTKAVKHVGAKLFGKSDPKGELVTSLNSNLASMTMARDLELHPFTAKDLDAIDRMRKKVERTKGQRGNAQTIVDLVDYLFQELKGVFTRVFGNEGAKIVDGVKAEFRKDMRENLKHNIGKNIREDFEVLDSVCERLRNSANYHIQKPASTKHQDRHVEAKHKGNSGAELHV